MSETGANVKKICFVINPLAGIGGPLGLKGSDGEAGLEALQRGARLIAPSRAREFIAEAKRTGVLDKVVLLTANGLMGEDELRSEGYQSPLIVYKYESFPTKAEDTKRTVTNCLREGAKLVVFVGGDGTARDILSALERFRNTDIPLLGVPGGVKMYSSVFAENPRAAAHVLHEWLENPATCEAEVLDIDEEAFRRGELRVRLYGYARTPCSRFLVGSSKQPSPATPDEEENKEAIARYIVESMEHCTLYVLGPGSTTAKIAELMRAPKTLLGVDVYHNGRLIASDVDEKTLYNIVSNHVKRGGKAKIIVSPIGGQGYILGRGNQQISPRIVRLVGKENIIVIATRSKIARLRKLRVDTGDSKLDRDLRGYIRVVVDYGEEYVMKVE